LDCCRFPTMPPNMASPTAKSLFQFHHILGDSHAILSNYDLLFRPFLSATKERAMFQLVWSHLRSPLVNAIRRIVEKSNPTQAPTMFILTSITPVAHYHRTVWFSLHLISHLYRFFLSISLPPLILPSFFIFRQSF